jgi:acylphosphatase
MADKVRAHAIISGRVQGVFYRMETQRAADRIGVTGWVKNRPEGTVEAVFEGAKNQVEAILKWCWDGPRLASVDNIDVTWEAFTGEYTHFDVTY